VPAEAGTLLAEVFGEMVLDQVKVFNKVPDEASARKALVDPLVAKASGIKVAGNDTLQSYGGKVVAALPGPAKTAAGALASAVSRADLEGAVDDLKDSLQNGVFTRGATDCKGVAARAVAMALFTKVGLGGGLTVANDNRDIKILVGNLLGAADNMPQLTSPTYKEVADKLVESVTGANTGVATDKLSAANAAKVKTKLDALPGTFTADLLGPLSVTLLPDPTVAPAAPRAPVAAKRPANPNGAKALTPVKGAAGQTTAGGTATPAPASDDAIQVAYMPDFEEQYAIRNKNFLAKTKYQYKFQNGT
jgi:hypothetical protein